MRFDVGHNGRFTADATFYGLVLLAFGLLAALSGFVSYFAPIYDTCKSVWDNVLLRASSLGVLLPITVAGSVVVMAGLTLVRQWRATQRLLSTLAPHRVPMPSRLVRIAQEVGLDDRIDCVSGVITAPFCYGFIRPRVCVPTSLLYVLDDSELRAVLRHEGYHAQSRDPLKIWLSRALARGLYFLPLAGDLRDSYLAAKEIAADETTVRTDELPLASALVKMLSVDAPWVAALSDVSVAGLIGVTRVSSNGAEERIRRLIDGRPAQLTLPSITSVLLSIIIVIAIFAASYTNLNAASVIPVSPECATENLLRGSETTLTIEWPTVSPEMNAAPVVQAVAGPGATTFGQFSCELLTPDCTQADR